MACTNDFPRSANEEVTVQVSYGGSGKLLGVHTMTDCAGRKLDEKQYSQSELEAGVTWTLDGGRIYLLRILRSSPDGEMTVKHIFETGTVEDSCDSDDELVGPWTVSTC